MEELRKALRSARIPTSSLRLLFEVGDELAYCLTVPGAKAVATWGRLRRALPKTGHWPVLLGEPEECEEVVENWCFDCGDEPTSELLSKALEVDCVGWLEDVCHDLQEDVGEWTGDPNESLLMSRDFKGFPSGDWPEDRPPVHTFAVPRDLLTDAPHPEVCIGLVPTREPWQAPVLLRFGGFNECPPPEIQGAFARRWHERYGAEVVSVTIDTVEMHVLRPPAGRAEALQLAREQYLFCQDIVDQGTETIEALAAGLLNGSAWFFWWD
jgi:hypothetical protein